MSAKVRGLGRGLDALLPKAEGGVQQVPVAQLRASPFQPRQHMDEEAIAELAASVAAKGVLQPIVVRPIEGGYEIVVEPLEGRGSLVALRLPGGSACQSSA